MLLLLGLFVLRLAAELYIAAELLKRANELIKNNIHPQVVMSGYRLAVKEAVKYIKSNLVVSADALGRENLINAGN